VPAALRDVRGRQRLELDISGATDSRWNDDDLNQMKAVPGSAFEAVQSGQILH